MADGACKVGGGCGGKDCDGDGCGKGGGGGNGDFDCDCGDDVDRKGGMVVAMVILV